jgi:hypothetical protein
VGLTYSTATAAAAHCFTLIEYQMKTTLETIALFTLATLIAAVTTAASLGSDPFAPNNAPVHKSIANSQS